MVYAASKGQIKGLWRDMFFSYPDALHKLNRVMAARCAEIVLALDHLPIIFSRFQTAETGVQVRVCPAL